MMQTLRIAVAGAGSRPGCRTWGYLAVIRKLGHMLDLCAVCDLSEERAKAAAYEYGIPTTYTDFETMLHHEQPDILFRLTPTDSCVGICVRAAELGCHVLSEIPIAPTRPMADRIIDACRAAGVKLEIAENVWLWPQERLKRRIVESELLGDLVHARLTYPCGSYHGFNAIRMIIDQEPVRVLGYANRTEVAPTTDYAGNPMSSAFWESATIEFPTLTCLYEMPPKNRAWRRQWDIEGTKGYLQGDELFLYERSGEQRYPIEWVYDSDQVLREVRVNTEPPVTWANPYAEQGISDMDDIAKATLLESIYQAVTHNAEPLYGWENARRDQELAIAVRESDLRGNVWIDLPLTEITEVEERIHAAFRTRYGYDPIDDIDAQLRAEYDRNAVMWKVMGWL
ncbi:MAG: Gfo/Idh/MocA family protein [Candidatus Zipacnadales bacterium]